MECSGGILMIEVIDNNLSETIGFSYMMGQINVLTAYGKALLNDWLTQKMSRHQVNKEFDLIERVSRLNGEQKEEIELILSHIHDLSHSFRKCRDGITLDLIELYEIKNQAIWMDRLSQLINQQNYLEELYFESMEPILMILSPAKNQIQPDFYIYNEYSDFLKTCRQNKRDLEREIQKAEVEKERALLLQKRERIVSEEVEEEYRIRVILTLRLQAEIEMMEYNSLLIGKLDLLMEKNRLSRLYKMQKPVLKQGNLVLKNMFNPLLFDHMNERDYTKNSIELVTGTTVLTGANMGGKSTVLKTIALNVMLAHKGFYVCADEADIPLFDSIYYLGQESKTIHGLSAFGNELKQLDGLIGDFKNKRTLVLVDEFARSTNPYEGQRFVQALARFLHTYPSFALIATHYDDIASEDMEHYQMMGLKKMEEQTIQSVTDFYQTMNYEIEKVKTEDKVPKEALKVALLLGLDKDFLPYLYRSFGGVEHE
jgi:DNA mismatch repair protein MutS2